MRDRLNSRETSMSQKYLFYWNFGLKLHSYSMEQLTLQKHLLSIIIIKKTLYIFRIFFFFVIWDSAINLYAGIFSQDTQTYYLIIIKLAGSLFNTIF